MTKLTIKLISPTLAASGFGSAIYDSDVIFDRFGFPYLPGRRIKGLLRESAEEIISICKCSNASLLNTLFGSKEGVESKLTISNLHLHLNSEVKLQIETIKIKYKSDFSYLLQPKHIQAQYTLGIQQTAMDYEKRIAKRTSLRSYRLLKNELEFETELNIDDLLGEEKALIELAAINLKRMGSRRNRGFGKISCILQNGKTFDVKTIQSLIYQLNQKSKAQITVPKLATIEKEFAKNSTFEMAYTIALQGPLVIARQRGDQNTVSTSEYFPGSAMRGLLANYWISRFITDPANAHSNNHFNDLFLKGGLNYMNASFSIDGKKLSIVPLHLQKEKAGDRFTLFDKFDQESTKDKKTIPINEFGIYSETAQGEILLKTGGPRKTSSFHMSRPNHLAGHSTGDGIFYYESIDEDQVFNGTIKGSEDALKYMHDQLKDGIEITTGRSKNTQYGSVRINFENPKAATPSVSTSTELLLIALSPLIVYNKYGFPSTDVDDLQILLKEQLGDVIIDNCITKSGKHEQHIGVWKSGTVQDFSFSEGSSFYLKFKAPPDEDKLRMLINKGLGEKMHLGFGEITFQETAQDFKGFQPHEINPPSASLSPLNNELKKLLKEILKQKCREVTRGKAIIAADALRSEISNHLIGRLEFWLKNNTLGDFADAVKSLKEKQAGKSLIKAGIFNQLIESGLPLPVSQYPISCIQLSDFISGTGKFETMMKMNKDDLFKIYWISFFSTLKKKNKLKP